MGNCTTGSIAGLIADTKFLSKYRKHFIKEKDHRGHYKVMWEDHPGAKQTLIGFVYHQPGSRWRATAMFDGRLKGLNIDFRSKFLAGMTLAEYYSNHIDCSY